MKATEEFLSKKLTERLNLAISPYNKYKLKKIYDSLKEKDKNIDYKNLSDLVRRILVFFIEIFESGKTFEDIKKVLSMDLREYIKKNSHMQITILQEEYIKLNKYYYYEDGSYSIMMNYIDLILKKGRFDEKKIIDFFNKFKDFLLGNKLTKQFEIEVLGNEFVLTYSGTYENIHFEQSKGLIALGGLFGFELTSYLYSPRYIKFSLKKTSLLNEPKASMDKRINLLRKNLKKFLNFHTLLNDIKVHTWIRMEQFENAIISFKNYEYGKKIIEEIIDDLLINSDQNLKADLLRLFSRLNWIIIPNRIKNDFSSFSSLISEDRMEYDLLRYFLKKYEIITE